MTHLREASITLPIGYPDVDHYITEELVTHFGGATVLDGQGLWSDCGATIAEPVHRFVAAAPADKVSDHTIRNIAYHAGQMATQHAMYITTTDGEAHILYMHANDNAEASDDMLSL